MIPGIDQIKESDFRLLYDNNVNVKNAYDISIMTPNYNRGQLLRNMLNSLLRQEFDMNKVEMVIVDDGGEAKEIEIIKSLKAPFRIRYYWQEHKGRRVGRARNVGVKVAKGETILFLDSDALASPGVLRDHFARHKKIKKLVLLGDMFDLKEGEKAVFKKRAGLDGPDMSAPQFFMRFIRRQFILPIIYSITRNPLGVCLCTLHASAKREQILEVNGFDESMDGRWGDEDLELGYRLEKNGSKVGWSGSSFVYHQYHPFRVDTGELDNRLKLFLMHPELIGVRKIGGLRNPFRGLSCEEIRRLDEIESTGATPLRGPAGDSGEYEVLFDNRMNCGVKPEVSLVIATYNRRQSLEGLLGSVEDQSLDKKKFEVIIADDGSDDGSLEFVKNKNLPFRLIYVRHEHKGFRAGLARNNGIDASSGDIIVLTDVDVLLPRNFLEAHYEKHKECENLALAGLAYYLGEGERVSPENLKAAGPFLKNILSVRMKLFVEKIRRSYLTYLDSRKKMSLGTCLSSINCSFKRKDFYKAGKFDKDFDGMWGDEDIDLGHRIHKDGIRIEFLNETIVYHRWHEYAKSRHMTDENRLLFLLKHQDLLKHRIINTRINRYFGKGVSDIRAFYTAAKRLRIMGKTPVKNIHREELKGRVDSLRRIFLPALIYYISGRSAKR